MRTFIMCLLGVFMASCNTSKKETLESHQYTNDLIHETSPYLLQHAHNPVNWKAWNPKTLEEAKGSKKLMVISIGYAACHWCHVMEHESFEDSTVAAVMNKHYVSIKVDREERPDVDQTYINAIQLMTGSAGWPLNVIALPDGRPVFGGTYFKKEDWIQALEQLQELYESDPQKLYGYADRLEEGIKSMDLITLNIDPFDFASFDTKVLIGKWSSSFDSIDGGSRGAPKFMMPNQLEYLFRAGIQNTDAKTIDHVTLTLQKMAYGGIYDHVGGGFSRYSTDEKWHIPHFEKMLYDNAQLVSLYSQAYSQNPDPLFKEVVAETLAFVATEMTHPNGAFYSSLDADSTNENGTLEEGAFYTYTLEELQQLITNDWPVFEAYFNINSYGKWNEADKYVLIRTQSVEALAAKFSLDPKKLQAMIKDWKKILFEYRNQREHPRLDDKTLTSWNALMIRGYVDAYKAFGNQAYLDAALANAQFMVAHQQKEDGSLYHVYKDEKSTINGYLEDYACMIDACIALYEVTLDDTWITLAKQLTDYSFEKFFDEERHMFYFTSIDDSEIISRNYEFRDNVIPASNSMMAKNLFVLSHHFDNQKYGETALQMLKNVRPEMERYPSSFSNWLALLENVRDTYYEIVVVGKDALPIVADLNQRYLPNKLVAGSIQPDILPLLEGRYVDNRTLIYVCVNNTCKLPVTSVEKALEFVK